jgi:L-asparaginase
VARAIFSSKEGTSYRYKVLDSNVVIIKMFPISEMVVADTYYLHGVILETYGSGNAPTEDWFT